MDKEEQLSKWRQHAQATGLNIIVVMKGDEGLIPFYCEEESDIHEIKAANSHLTYVTFVEVKKDD